MGARSSEFLIPVLWRVGFVMKMNCVVEIANGLNYEVRNDTRKGSWQVARIFIKAFLNITKQKIERITHTRDNLAARVLKSNSCI